MSGEYEPENVGGGVELFRIFPGTNNCSPTVLPLGNLGISTLTAEQLAMLNVIQLSYSREVATAQRRAYDRLLEIFGGPKVDRQVLG